MEETKQTIVKVSHCTGVGHHSFKKEEQNAFTNHINYHLKDDKDLEGIIPIETQNIFKCVEDGIILCKLINKAQEGAILPSAINLRKGQKQMVIFKKDQNLNLAISSAKSLGCVVINTFPKFIRQGREHIILGLVWQIIRLQAVKKIDLKNTPQIIKLKKEEEQLSDLLKLPPQEVLLRWLNYHLQQDKSEKRVKNFSKDLSDGEAYMHVFNHISKIQKQDFQKQPNQKADIVISKAKQLNIKAFLTSQDIINGQEKLNILFCAQIFNTNPGLILTQEEQKEYQSAAMLDDDNPEDSRQIRMFKMWINSMGIEDVYVTHLIEDMKDGVYILKVIDRIRPKIVDWKKVALKQLNMRIRRIQNCNYAVELADKQLKCKLIGIGGIDLVDGKKKLVLGMVWQICKIDALEKIGDLSEEKLIEWANKRVPQNLAITSLKDKSLKNCQYWFKLLQSIEPRAINHQVIMNDESDEALQNNCKYAISVARKLGAAVFIVWQHLKQVNNKLLLTFLASIYHVANSQQQVP